MADACDVWTQGTSIAALNTGRLAAMLAGGWCALRIGEDWDKPKTRCPFCNAPGTRERTQHPADLGPNARREADRG